jgi:hypothetical protein
VAVLAPVLYDLTNGKRYAADISGGLLRFVLPQSFAERKLVLVNEDNPNNVGSLGTRNFINYSSTNQGDYLIISNKRLINGGNAINDYVVYRSTAAGGSFNPKIYDVDELLDQFAYGIKMHPLSVKNFLPLRKKQIYSCTKVCFSYWQSSHLQ